jgi:hypothetical protein
MQGMGKRSRKARQEQRREVGTRAQWGIAPGPPGARADARRAARAAERAAELAGLHPAVRHVVSVNRRSMTTLVDVEGALREALKAIKPEAAAEAHRLAARGVSWNQIGKRAGMTRQGAMKRYGAKP